MEITVIAAAAVALVIGIIIYKGTRKEKEAPVRIKLEDDIDSFKIIPAAKKAPAKKAPAKKTTAAAKKAPAKKAPAKKTAAKKK